MPSAKAATYNNLFAGYVRVQDGKVTVACDASSYAGNGVIPESATYVIPNSATALSNVEVRAEFGTNYYNQENGLVTALNDEADTAENDYYEQYTGGDEGTWGASGASYDVVSDDLTSSAVGSDMTQHYADNGYTAIWYSEDGDSDMVAKTGTYTIRYRLTYADGSDGESGIPKGTELAAGDMTYATTETTDVGYENTIALTWTAADGETSCSATATYTTSEAISTHAGTWEAGSVTSDLTEGSTIKLTYAASAGDSLESGTYTFEITAVTQGETVNVNAGATVKTPTFSAKVTNSLVMPKVSVTIRAAETASVFKP